MCSQSARPCSEAVGDEHEQAIEERGARAGRACRAGPRGCAGRGRGRSGRSAARRDRRWTAVCGRGRVRRGDRGGVATVARTIATPVSPVRRLHRRRDLAVQGTASPPGIPSLSAPDRQVGPSRPRPALGAAKLRDPQASEDCVARRAPTLPPAFHTILRVVAERGRRWFGLISQRVASVDPSATSPIL